MTADRNTGSMPAAAAATYVCDSAAHTDVLAREFALRLQPGDWVGLIGPLGAGKSVFARAVGRAWGVDGDMPSPTYTLLTVHRGRCPVYHMDWYRVSTPEELDFAGLTPYVSSEGICLVEWADRVQAAWPNSGWVVGIDHGGGNRRAITIERFGEQGDRIRA